MAASLVMNSGSLLRLKVRRRCGCSWWTVQNPLHRPQGEPSRLGHHAAGPVGRLAGRLATGQRHHLLHDGLGRARLAGLSGLIAQQPGDAGLGEALLPAPDRRPAEPGSPGDLGHVQPLGGVQDDADPRHMLLRPVAIGQDRRQALAIRGREKRANRLCHAQIMAQPNGRVNPPHASLH